MKSIIEFINESKYFKLTDSERDALASLIGVLTNNVSDDDYEESIKPLKKELSKEEIDSLDELYTYVLDDKQTYPTINRNILIPERDLIIKIIKWLDENDAWYEENDYELVEILDKLTSK